MAAILITGIATVGPARADILAIEQSGTVFDIASGSGVGTLLPGNGPTGANALARDAGGTFFTASGARLYTLDAASGAGTAGASLSLGGAAIDLTAMAFLGGDLYAFNRTAASAGTSYALWRIDPASGLGLASWSATTAGVQGLAAYDGTLYGWDVALGLVRIGFGGSAATFDDVNAALGTQGASIQTLAFDAAGALYGAESALYRIDRGTGAVSFVGAGGYGNVRGMEFVDVATVPEPATLVLLGLGLAGLAVAGRRRATSR